MRDNDFLAARFTVDGQPCALSAHSAERYWQRIRPGLPNAEAATAELLQVIEAAGELLAERPEWLPEPLANAQASRTPRSTRQRRAQRRAHPAHRFVQRHQRALRTVGRRACRCRPAAVRGRGHRPRLERAKAAAGPRNSISDDDLLASIREAYEDLGDPFGSTPYKGFVERHNKVSPITGRRLATYSCVYQRFRGQEPSPWAAVGAAGLRT